MSRRERHIWLVFLAGAAVLIALASASRVGPSLIGGLSLPLAPFAVTGIALGMSRRVVGRALASRLMVLLAFLISFGSAIPELVLRPPYPQLILWALALAPLTGAIFSERAARPLLAAAIGGVLGKTYVEPDHFVSCIHSSHEYAFAWCGSASIALWLWPRSSRRRDALVNGGF